MRFPFLALFSLFLACFAPARSAQSQSANPDDALLRRLERMDQRRHDRQRQTPSASVVAFPDGSPQEEVARRLSSKSISPPSVGLEDASPGEPSARLPSPPGARVMREIAYGPDPQQRMDVYAPRGASRAPVIFMAHGGGWTRGDKAMSDTTQNKVGHYLPKGYGFISVNYRMSDSPDPLAQARDVAAALAFAQSKAASWGLDGSRFVLMGHSSGAHLISLIAADPSEALALGAKPWLGAISLDGSAFNMGKIMSGPHARLYDPIFGSNSEYWDKASPASRLKAAPAPMLLVCSSRRWESCSQAEGFAIRARSLRGRVFSLPEPLSRSQINTELGAPGDYTNAVDGFLSSLNLP